MVQNEIHNKTDLQVLSLIQTASLQTIVYAHI